MRDISIHRTSTKKIFQMFDYFTKKPMNYNVGKHNYTRVDLATMNVGDINTFFPYFGNENPQWTILKRIK